MAVNPTISTFIARAGNKDFARNNLFRVDQIKIEGILDMGMTAQESTNGNNQNIGADLLYCQGGRIPGRSNPTANVQYMGMNLPYNTSTVQYTGNDDYSLTFFVDRNSEIAHKFEAASRLIFDDKTSTGDWRFPRIENIITVSALGFDLEPIEHITFHGVTFKGFDAIEFQTANGDGQAINITCHFSYLYYDRIGSTLVVSPS